MRENMSITVVAGTPINVATGMTAAQMATAGITAAIPQKLANRVFVQMLHGGSGLGYVMDGILPRGRVPASSASGDLTAELAVATAGAPGGSYSDGAPNDAGLDVDLALMWVDGAHSGDVIKVSYFLKSSGG